MSIIVDHEYVFRDKAAYMMAVVFLRNREIFKRALKDCAELEGELGDESRRVLQDLIRAERR